MSAGSEHLSIFTIYRSPLDYPGLYVVREFAIVAGGQILRKTKPQTVCGSLAEARAAVPQGLFRLDRHPDDEPQIVESWI